MGIGLEHNHVDLVGNQIWIRNEGIEVPSQEVLAGPRIGIDYAEEDKYLPYRFLWK